MTKHPKIQWRQIFEGREQRIASGFDRLILYEFDALEDHRAHMEDSLSTAKRSVEKRIREASTSVRKDDQQDYADFLNEEYATFVEVLPRLQRYAQLLVIYAAFEHALDELCAIVKGRSGFTLSVDDLAGKGIVRARSYLSKVAGVHAPFETRAWNSAILLNKIRNAIAHQNGEIKFDPKNKGSLAYQVRSMPNIQLKQIVEGHEYTHIIVDADFVRDAIVTLKTVLTDIASYKLYA